MSNITKADRIRELEAYHESVEAYRTDGYLNMLNKVGTKQDNTTAWQYEADEFASDQKITDLYIGNGLFSKIIDRPAEDAIAKGLDLSDFGDDISKEIDKRLDKLGFNDAIITAEKWARLYGGSIVVMITNDGGGLEEPINWNKVQSIEELVPFERPLIQPNVYQWHYQDDIFRHDRDKKFGQPEFYDVFSQFGQFRVHYSRCLIFRNGKVPENTKLSLYREWGIPVYHRIAKALRETTTSHEDGTKLLERSVLGVYKMKNLSQLLATDEGEDKVIQRLQVIDMARNIINSMAIDNDGEDYSYINASMAGASDIIDRTCNMLSAVTDIPQTILFGKDPSGMDSTGDNDRDNYFQLLNRIQTNSYKAAAEKVIKVILKQMVAEGLKSEDIPDYEIRFNPMKQMSEEEQANVDSIKAGVAQTKAQTAQIYVDMQALDPSEVRAKLSEANDYEIQGIVENDNLEIPEEAFDLRKQQAELAKIGGDQEQGGDPMQGDPQEGADNQPQSGMMNEDGGSGSGNLGHSGRPGLRGGSGSGGVSSAARSIGSAKESPAARVNPYNDPEIGKGTVNPGDYNPVVDTDEKKAARKDAQDKWDTQEPIEVRDAVREEFGETLERNKARIAEKDRWRVDSQSAESLAKNHPDADLWITPAGNTIAVDNGDIIGVSCQRGSGESGRALMKYAVEHGGVKLDSYAGNHGFYTKMGFEPVSWCYFDEQYKPGGWDGTRDYPEPVIFYRYTGRCIAEDDPTNFLKTVAPSEDYGKAMEARDNLVGGNK